MALKTPAYGKKPKLPAEVVIHRYPRPAASKPLADARPPTKGAAVVDLPARYEVQGRKASDLEDRVWRMLLALGWNEDDVDFQVNVMGGRRSGGALLDFVIWAPGMPIVVEPNGDYWHTATLQQRQQDADRLARIREAWGRPFRYIALPQGEILTDDMAYQTLLLKVGRG